jgi:hypothetical protein
LLLAALITAVPTKPIPAQRASYRAQIEHFGALRALTPLDHEVSTRYFHRDRGGNAFLGGLIGGLGVPLLLVYLYPVTGKLPIWGHGFIPVMLSGAILGVMVGLSVGG